ncbi:MULTISPECIES: hypothetical protein [unclassified Mesorhizobium]|uniref:hypothetical protein n=1 Tax=unclassified Mesorhizobium TaxID=325217 RepID=UPI0033392406
MARGYVQFFEPEVFVEAQEGLAEAIGLAALRNDRLARTSVIGLDALLRKREDRNWSELSMGLSIVDPLAEIYETERRFRLRDARPAVAVPVDPTSALVEAVFGDYPADEASDYFAKSYANVFKPEVMKADHALWRNVFLDGAQTPLRTTQYGLEVQRSWQHDLVVFIFDPRRSIDVIDLWNMRSEPSPVLPVPIDWADVLADDIAHILQDETRPLQGNPNGAMHHPTIEFARSISDDVQNSTVEKIIAAAGDFTPSVKRWRNEIWVPQNTLHPRYLRAEITARDKRFALTTDDKCMIQFDALAPDFAERYGGQNARWVNTARIGTYGNNIAVATVFPFNTFDRHWPSLDTMGNEVLVGAEGWSFVQKYKDSVESFRAISHENAVIGSLKVFGIEAIASDAGLVAGQVLNHLEGFWGVHLLANLDTLALLNSMAGSLRKRQLGDDAAEEHLGGKSRSLNVWHTHIEKRNSKGLFSKVKLEDFTRRNIIRLGIETGCPHCQFENWHSLAETQYELTCERCLKVYPFPQSGLKKNNGNWAFRAIGPFAVPDYARGAYGAILVARVFDRLSGGGSDAMTFSTALKLRFDGIEREADYVIFKAASDMDTNRPPDLIIGEAKSLGDGELLKKADIDRMIDIGSRLPGSYLVVSVLRNSFTVKEKQLLTRLVKWGRRLNNDFRPTNPVILFTGNELLFEFHLTDAWKKLGGTHAKFASYEDTHDLDAIANATQSIYLDIPTFDEERRKHWERKHQKRKSALKGEAPSQMKDGNSEQTKTVG